MHLINDDDEVVEVNSNSTTKSQKEKRQLRNSRIQMNLQLNQKQRNVLMHNRRSSESSSEFPLSSPSNPQAGDVGDGPAISKFPHRPVLLKNTLPSDSFERLLALMSTSNPQMTLTEKMIAWSCEDDLSDVEDVINFDAQFQKREHYLRERNKVDCVAEPTTSEYYSEFNYDFNIFRNMIKESLQTSIRRKQINQCSLNQTTQSKDKPSSSSAAAHLAAQRRLRAAAEAEMLLKKRQHKDANRKPQNSTTPPATSSSENDVECYPNKNENACNQKPTEKVFTSSSDVSQEELRLPSVTVADKVTTKIILKDGQILKKENNSVFRLDSLNREIDKNNSSIMEEKKGIIQMRWDCEDDYKAKLLQSKKHELFKTPVVPPKYLNATNEGAAISDLELGRKKPNASTSKPASSTASPLDEKPQVSADVTDFHEQHEFCNYLGLTGMSTATAVANAVAELAKCNLARRSLRVRRLQHQEKKLNPVLTASSEKALEALKKKQLKEIKRRSKCSSVNSDGDDLSQPVGELLGVPQIKADKKKDTEIKILCHIAGNTKGEVEQVSKSYIKQITAPIRQTLLRHLKRNAKDGGLLADNEREFVHVKANKSQSLNRLTDKSNSMSAKTSSSIDIHPLQSADKNDKDQPEDLRNKFQKYLEASRQNKPSIFIVKSIECNETKQSNCSENPSECDEQSKPSNSYTKENNASSKKATDSKGKITKIRKKLSQRMLNGLRGRNTKTRLISKLNTRSFGKNQLRQLRSRKILIVKRVVKSNPKADKATQKTPSRSTPNSDVLYKRADTSLYPKHLSPPRRSRRTPTPVINNEHISNAETHSQSTQVLYRTRGKFSTISVVDQTLAQSLVNQCTLRLSPRRHQHTPQSGTSVLLVEAGNTPPPSPQINISELKPRARSTTFSQQKQTENEMVVVSSTTEDQPVPSVLPTVPYTQTEASRTASFTLLASKVSKKDSCTQSCLSQGIRYINTPSNLLSNPLRSEQGSVLYIYYELDTLIVIQEKLVSFWKFSKLLNVLIQPTGVSTCQTNFNSPFGVKNQPPLPSSVGASDAIGDWIHLAECKRLVADTEIAISYANRICVHNSIPVYLEMRCRSLPHQQRECNLLSMYINVYYYHDEDMVSKMHSIQLDSIQSTPANVVFTTITESRYFVMSWPQENVLGKVRSGLCKYSLTPLLDTLASIREFKSIRYELLHLECSEDDKLLGFGATQLTIWDHRSGDVLMNFDLDIALGRHMGSIYYPSLEIGQNNMILLFQYMPASLSDDLAEEVVNSADLVLIACSISHTSPTYRVLKRYKLPLPAFADVSSAINTGEHLVLTAANDEEIWISCADPNMMTWVPAKNTQRFYSRKHSQFIELTPQYLTVETFANHILKLAAGNSGISL